MACPKEPPNCKRRRRRTTHMVASFAQEPSQHRPIAQEPVAQPGEPSGQLQLPSPHGALVVINDAVAVRSTISVLPPRSSDELTPEALTPEALSRAESTTEAICIV